MSIDQLIVTGGVDRLEGVEKPFRVWVLNRTKP